MFKATNHFVTVFPNNFDRTVYDTNLPIRIIFFPTHISISLTNFHFFFDTQRSKHFFSGCNGSSLYQCRVNCRNRKAEGTIKHGNCYCCHFFRPSINPYPTAFPYGNGMVLHFFQQQESSTTKTVHKVINKGLKTYV